MNTHTYKIEKVHFTEKAKKRPGYTWDIVVKYEFQIKLYVWSFMYFGEFWKHLYNMVR